MSCEIVIILDGYAEMRGMPAPKKHRARRALVKHHLSHLAEMCNGLYGLGLEARHCNRCGMTEKEWRKATRLREALTNSIPVH